MEYTWRANLVILSVSENTGNCRLEKRERCSMRIIVADDEYFARKALVKSIGQLEEEIELCEAEDGTEVMELLEAGGAD